MFDKGCCVVDNVAGRDGLVDGLGNIGNRLLDVVGWGLLSVWVVDRVLDSTTGDLGDDKSERLSGRSDSEDKLIGDEGSGMVRVADQSGS